MKDRVYSLLSLCAKAGRLTSGNFSVESAVKDNKAYIVIVANEYGDKDSLGRFIGKEMRTSVAVLDKGFADQIINYISINENMEA